MQEELAVWFVMLALIRLALRSGANGEVNVDCRTFAASINLPLAARHQMIGGVRSFLRSTQRRPNVIQNFFRHELVRYAA